MPEGDTILRAANRIRPVLEGAVPDEIVTPQPRHARDNWPERLRGRHVVGVDTHGKHLFLRFEGGLVLHSHLRMTGAWAVYRHGARWRRAPKRAWLVLRARGQEVVEFDGPVLELMTAGRAALRPAARAARPGRARARVRRGALPAAAARGRPHARARRRTARPAGRRRASATSGRRRAAGARRSTHGARCRRSATPRRSSVIANVRPRMQRAVAAPRKDPSDRHVYNRTGGPCHRCGARILARGQGDDNRTTYWCPGCQH